jgi:hypothetical protein
MTIIELKAEIFDLLKQQESLQQEFRILEEKKQKLLRELQGEENGRKEESISQGKTISD